MTDIALAWYASAAEADWSIVGGDIATGSDLETAVILSLFTDRRAPDTYVGEPRGWWGDSYSATPWGSRLWTLDRAAISGTTSLLRQAEDYCREALQWMIDDGVAASVTVVATWLNNTALSISISIAEPIASAAHVFQFSWAWTAISPVGA